VMHQYYQGDVWPRAQARPWSLNRRDSPGLVDGLLALSIALGVALPWFVVMFRAHGWQAVLALRVPPDGLDRRLSLLPRLIDLAPVALPMGVYGAVRAIRSALVDEANGPDTVGGSLWVIWLAVAALAPAVWRSGPQSAFDLILLVPLSLLAAQTIADLVNRRISVRGLIGLAPATAMSVAWWASADLRRAVDDLFHGRADAATALGLHLALDLIVASVWIIRAMNRWARRRDDRQRLILAVFLVAVLAITVVDGLLEVLFRHKTTHDLLSLRTVILRHHRDSPFNVVAVVSPNPSIPARVGAGPIAEGPSPGGRLRFILRTALPHLPQRDLNAIDELFNLPEGERLIILSGTEQRLSSAEQAKLGLEAIHPGYSGILDAYATARVRLPRR
jgi:hypothetical protein